MSDAPFVHLHVHSSYSLLEGALTIARLAELAKADQPARARAHRHRQHVRRAGILREDGRRPASSRSSAARSRSISATSSAIRAIPATSATLPRIVLLAATEEGYRSLMRLTSRAFLETPSNEAAAYPGRLAGRARPTASSRSPAGRGPLDLAIAAGQNDLARRALRPAARAVRRPALCRIAAPRPAGASAAAEAALLDLAYAQALPLVATNEPFFATRRRLRSA